MCRVPKSALVIISLVWLLRTIFPQLFHRLNLVGRNSARLMYFTAYSMIL